MERWCLESNLIKEYLRVEKKEPHSLVANKLQSFLFLTVRIWEKMAPGKCQWGYTGGNVWACEFVLLPGP